MKEKLLQKVAEYFFNRDITVRYNTSYYSLTNTKTKFSYRVEDVNFLSLRSGYNEITFTLFFLQGIHERGGYTFKYKETVTNPVEHLMILFVKMIQKHISDYYTPIKDCIIKVRIENYKEDEKIYQQYNQFCRDNNLW